MEQKNELFYERYPEEADALITFGTRHPELKLVAPHEVQEIIYRKQGNFTVCLLINRDGRIHAGVSKRNIRLDPRHTIAGKRFALLRAAQDNV